MFACDAAPYDVNGRRRLGRGRFSEHEIISRTLLVGNSLSSFFLSFVLLSSLFIFIALSSPVLRMVGTQRLVVEKC